MTEYKLVRSMRKTVAITVEADGTVVVRAPHTAARAVVDGFVQSKQAWIEETTARMKQRAAARQRVSLTPEQIRECKAKARAYLTSRAEHFAGIMGVRFKEIKISSAHTRWGSCNAKGTINFAYRLVLAPPELADYVVVHELAHLVELNHSKRFWRLVDRILPDYKDRERRLQEWQNGLEFIQGGF